MEVGDPQEAEGVARSEYQGGEERSAEYIRCELHLGVSLAAGRWRDADSGTRQRGWS